MIKFAQHVLSKSSTSNHTHTYIHKLTHTHKHILHTLTYITHQQQVSNLGSMANWVALQLVHHPNRLRGSIDPDYCHNNC